MKDLYMYIFDALFILMQCRNDFFSNLFPEDMHAYGMGVVGTLTDGGRLG